MKNLGIIGALIGGVVGFIVARNICIAIKNYEVIWIISWLITAFIFIVALTYGGAKVGYNLFSRWKISKAEKVNSTEP